MQTTHQQRQAITALFVRTGQYDSAAEGERLRRQGTDLLIEQMDLVDSLFNESGIKVIIEMHPGATLPASRESIQLIPGDETMEGNTRNIMTLRVAANAPDIAESFEEAMLTLVEAQAPIKDGFAVTQEDLGPIKRDAYADNAGTTQSSPRRNRATGQVSSFDTDSPSRKGMFHANTRGDLSFYRNMRDAVTWAEAQGATAEEMKWAHAQRMEWDLRLTRLFDEESSYHKLPPAQWIRALRVLNGIRVTEISAHVGGSSSLYSQFENGHRRGFPPRWAAICLDKNLFHLPTQPDGKVQQEWADKFLQKTHIVIPEKPGMAPAMRNQLSAAIKARALSEFPGEEQIPPMSHYMAICKLNGGNRTMDGKHLVRQSIRADTWETYRQKYNIPKEATYLYAIPRKHDKVLSTIKMETHSDLVKRRVFELGERCTDVKQFLGAYRKEAGILYKSVGRRLRMTGEAVGQIVARSPISDSNIDRFIETNAFELPTGIDGKIHPDVADMLRQLNKNHAYANPYISVSDFAKRHSIRTSNHICVAPQSDWRQKIIYEETPERAALDAAWSEMEHTYKTTGNLTINNTNVRCWLDVWDKLQVHKDDSELVYSALGQQRKQAANAL